MSFLFSADYYEVRKNGISPAQNMAAYLGGSAIQTVGDNPVTAYRQLVQQYAKGLDGQAVDPKVAASEANAVFLKSPISASLSGLWPRLIGVLFKRIPKFGILLGYGVVTGDKSGKPGFAAATAASIPSSGWSVSRGCRNTSRISSAPPACWGRAGAPPSRSRTRRPFDRPAGGTGAFRSRVPPFRPASLHRPTPPPPCQDSALPGP